MFSRDCECFSQERVKVLSIFDKHLLTLWVEEARGLGENDRALHKLALVGGVVVVGLFLLLDL